MIPSGRGAAMQRFLEAMQKEQQAAEEEEQPPRNRPVGRGRSLFPETDLEEGIREIAIARPTGRGRGLQSLPPVTSTGLGRYGEMAAESRPGRSSQPSEPEEVARPVGRGRSALLAAYLAQQDVAPGASAVKSGTFTTQKTSRAKDVSPEREVREPIVRKGTHGRSQEVVCNYINLEMERGKGVYEYTVDFAPAEDNLSMKSRMINQHLDKMGNVKSYNGTRLLLSVELKTTSFQCDHPLTGNRVTMMVTYKGRAKSRDAADVYNMLFRRIMVHLGLKSMGRKFFDPTGAMTVPQHRLEVWPGYVTAVMEYEGGIQLCCDASHRVMRTESVLEVMSHITHANPQKYREEILKVVLGAVVLTRYNNRVYRVDDVGWDQTPMHTFTDTSGKEISFAEYYKVHYDIQIRDKNQPLLISRVERKKDQATRGVQEVRMVCLIPELCYITGLTDAMRADFRIMKDLTQKLQLTPSQRYEGLCRFLDNIKGNKPSQELLAKWGLRISSLPVRLMARVVDQEKILYGDGHTIVQPGNANWVVNNQLLVPKEMNDWAILHVVQDTRVAQDFERSMRTASSQMGMRVYPGKMVKVSDNRNEAFLQALRETIRPGLQMVVIFFPSLRSDRYAAVKKVCCIERPIPSQVIQSRTLSRPEKARSIIKKIAMQINCKLGGCLWGVSIPYEKLMVCGMDVYHGPGNKHISVMGFVATSDPQQTTWYSRVGFGGSHQEIADNLRICMAGALKKYNETNGFYPDRIMMFRDGVGEGQLRMTQDYEVPQLLRSFVDLGFNYKPKMTVVVCQKRIMTRLLAMQGGSGSNLRLQNPGPGTVLDHTVTKHDWYDFYLVSQSSNRGTVSPTHYIVVYDDGNIKPDHVQRLTYKLTHLYFNWTGTISIPAPAQYAHRLAQLVGQHLHKDPSSVLSDKLFFL